ncbi:MAG: hypothetical protein AABX84_02210 [Nanoarchaeota archaeon]
MWQNIRFWIARWNGKKIPIYITIVAIMILFFLPTGDFTDLITIPLIGLLGTKIFILISAVLLIIFFSNGKARSMFKSPTIKETKRICRKITDTKRRYKNCISENA